MLCANISSSDVARFEISVAAGQPVQRYEIKPGEVVDLPDGYCAGLQLASGRRPSVIERLTGDRVVPETDPRAEAIIAASRGRLVEPAQPPPPVRKGRRGPVKPVSNAFVHTEEPDEG